MIGEPSVSVIIPCYNQGRFLPEALDSVIAQTCQDWECLIINDGSTDHTPRVAARYANQDNRIRCLNQPNRGLGNARNRGLSESRGRYIQFLDADDILLPQKITRQLELLEGERRPALAYCDFYITDGADATKRTTNQLCEPRLIMKAALQDLASRWETELSIPVHCFLFDAAFFRDRGCSFDEALASHEDWDYWMQIFGLDPVVKHVAEKCVVYRRHNHAMCTDVEIMWRGFSRAIDKQRTLFNGDGNMRKILRSKKREMRRFYLAQVKMGLVEKVATRTLSFFSRHVPWPVQKIVRRMIEMD